MNISDKVAIVTGGGQEIGRHIAIALAKKGAVVYVADINLETARESATIIEKEYERRAYAVAVDVGSEDDVRSMIETVVGSEGRIDILVNNAGIPGPVKPVEAISCEDWTATVAVNLTGVFLCCKYCVPIMKNRRNGSIINIASVSGKRPLALRIPYTTTKMGVIGFSRSLALEVGKWNIRVNSVCPGSVVGPRQSIVFKGIMQSTGKRLEEVEKEKRESAALHGFVYPEDVADLVCFLASDAAKKITGQDVNVCAGAVMY